MNVARTIRHRLLYDGDCGFCRRWCDWAKRRGAEAAVEFLPCQLADKLRRLAGIADGECVKSAFLIESAADGQIVSVRKAAAAINGVLAQLPGRGNAFWRLLSRLYRVPAIKQLEEIGYRVIARIRGRLGSGAPCRMPMDLDNHK